ncbi:hypothetical protein LPIBR_90070 [Lacticaseibacillus paracasei]|nr:hypothetical protein LPIBR_90070 [Lacticaseibacillus paracasei]
MSYVCGRYTLATGLANVFGKMMFLLTLTTIYGSKDPNIESRELAERRWAQW